jgi:hypothetical protein
VLATPYKTLATGGEQSFQPPRDVEDANLDCQGTTPSSVSVEHRLRLNNRDRRSRTTDLSGLSADTQVSDRVRPGK